MDQEIDNENAVIEHLADKCSLKILSLTSKKEHSAIELSDELKVSLSTVYRKLKLLERSGLVQHVKTVINLAGNDEKFYRCAVREATVSFHEGRLSVSLKKEDYSDRIVRLWKRFAH